MSAAPTAARNLVQIRPLGVGLLGKWMNITNFKKVFIYTFIGNSPTGQIRRRIFTLVSSDDADSRKDVPFRGFVDIAPHFGGEIPRNPQFLGRK